MIPSDTTSPRNIPNQWSTTRVFDLSNFTNRLCHYVPPPTFWLPKIKIFFMVSNYFWCPKSSPYLWHQTYLLTICTQCACGWLKKALRHEVSLGILYTLLITKNDFQGGRCRGGKKPPKPPPPLKSCLPLWFSALRKSKKEQKSTPGVWLR